MQPDDFSDLQELWNTVDPAVTERVEVISRQVIRRQRIVETVEFLVGAALLGLVGLVTFNVGTPTAAVIGSAISLLIIYSGWSRYRLRRIEELVDVRGQHAYLTQLLVSKQARMRRLIIGLVSFIPGLVLGNMFASATGISDEQLQEAMQLYIPGGAIVGVLVMLLTIIVPIVWLVRNLLRERAEIRQLRLTLQSFDDELEKDSQGL